MTVAVHTLRVTRICNVYRYRLFTHHHFSLSVRFRINRGCRWVGVCRVYSWYTLTIRLVDRPT